MATFGAVLSLRSGLSGVTVRAHLQAIESGDGSTMSLADADMVAARVLAAAQVTPIWADARKMNGAAVIGTGVTGDKWRGV